MPGGTAVLYDLMRRDGPMTLALRYDIAGGLVDFVRASHGHAAPDAVAGAAPDQRQGSFHRPDA